MDCFRRTRWLAIFLALGSASSAGAEGIAVPTDQNGPLPFFASALETRLLEDADDGTLDTFSLLGAALVAGGVEEPRVLNLYEAKIDQWVAEMKCSSAADGSPREQAQAIFEFMHRRILRSGYRLECSSLKTVLDEGYFNCVSASVLFNGLAGRCGLEARGLEVPGHAMSRLVLPEGPLEVETTCARWFHLIDDPQKRALAIRRALGHRDPKDQAPAESREVSDVELIATIYYNRGVDLLAEKRFAEAVSSNRKALRLDPRSETSRGNLLATVNNWAIDRSNAGAYDEALRLLRRGLALDPSYPTFLTNMMHVHHRWSEQLCGENRFEEAAALLTAAVQAYPDEPFFDQSRWAVYRRWARDLLNRDQMDRAFAVLDRAVREYPDAAAVENIETTEVNDRAIALIEEGRYQQALVLLDRALARHPTSTLLAENRRAAARWAELALGRGQDENFAVPISIERGL